MPARSPAPSPVGNVPVDDGHPAVAPEGPLGDLDPWRSLPPLVLATVDELDHPRHRLRPVAGRHQLFGAEVVLDVADQDGVELFVRREAVGVLLARLELRRRWL